MKVIFRNAVELSKEICKAKLSNGDTAVDCTMGNGNDTAFLGSLVGEKGKVYAFDIQNEAISNTRKKLHDLNFLDRTEIILDGHENIDQYIKSKVKLIIFNLGYLPRGDRKITTKKETTLQAVRKCLDMLDSNGIILLIMYPGHEAGRLEKQALERFSLSLNQKEYSVAKLCFINQINNPPELLCIERVCH